MKTFKTKEIAEDQLKIAIDKTYPSFFCPLVRDLCKRNCVCIGKPFLIKEKNIYTLYEWYCDNPMLRFEE